MKRYGVENRFSYVIGPTPRKEIPSELSGMIKRSVKKSRYGEKEINQSEEGDIGHAELYRVEVLPGKARH
jgi:hypothetical protein